MKKSLSNLTFVTFLALIIILSFSLGGCGSSNGPGNPPGGDNSGQAAAPTFNPPPGAPTWAPVKVTLASQSPNVIIKYTTDGSDPKTSSTAKYTNPVTVDKSMTIKAYAYGNGFTDSNVVTATYTRTVVTRALSLLICGSSSSGDYDIFVYNSDGSGWESGQSRLTDFLMASAVQRISMTSTGKLFFRSQETFDNPPKTAEGYYLLDMDARTVSKVSGINSGFDAFISANGSKIVFYSYTQEVGVTAFYTINPDGTGLDKFADADGSDGYPTISADGTKVVASQNDHDLYLFVKGQTPSRITNSPTVNEDYPVISPDGNKVAYISGADNNIYIMNTDGTGTPFQVTQRRGTSQLAWSSDGTKLVYIQDFTAYSDQSQRGIHIINSDGTQDYLVMGLGSMEFTSIYKSPVLR